MVEYEIYKTYSTEFMKIIITEFSMPYGNDF